jgi:hypothetical protein
LSIEHFLRDGKKGILRPRVEPIDSTAIDQGREHSATCSETGTNRTHAQHNMQVLSNQVHEVLQDGFSGLDLAGSLRKRSHGADNPLQLVGLEQVRHFTAVQDIVDVF